MIKVLDRFHDDRDLCDCGLDVRRLLHGRQNDDYAVLCVDPCGFSLVWCTDAADAARLILNMVRGGLDQHAEVLMPPAVEAIVRDHAWGGCH